MVTFIIILGLCNLFINRYFKRIESNFGVIRRNLKLVSKVYDRMNKILTLLNADRVAINKISIEDGVILKRMIHEVSRTKKPLINELKTLPIEHKEYVKLKRMDELGSYGTYVDEVLVQHEKGVLLNEGIKYVTNIKIIDKISTAYILTIYYKDYDIKTVKYKKSVAMLYVRLINRIFKNNIEVL